MQGQQLKSVIKKFSKSKDIELKYTIIKKTKLKHGQYKKYFRNGQINELGNYTQGKKHGPWEIYNAQGILRWTKFYKNGKLISNSKNGIWKELNANGKQYLYDYNLNKRIPPNIPILIQYPTKAREEGIAGQVSVKVILDAQCEVKELKIVKSLRPDFDKEAIKGVKLFIEKLNYYEDCINYNRIIDVDFAME